MTDDTQDPATNHLGPPKPKDPAAVSLGRRGGQAGRGASKRRSTKQCQAAARARWDKHPKPKAHPAT